MGVPVWIRSCCIAALPAAAFAIAWPAGAQAAEVVVRAPDEVRVEQGKLTPLELEVTAEGVIGCGTNPNSPSTAVLDSVYSLVDDQPPAAADPAAPLRFYGDNRLVLLPPLGCGTSWDGAPEPYRVSASVAVSSNTPPGTYQLTLAARVANPGGALFAPLEDRQPETVTVVVEPVVTELSAPLEDLSINLLPVSGTVRVRYPGSTVSVPLTEPVQVPPATGVNADEGFVTLLSDRVGTGVVQSATFWSGSFRVDYTRLLRPERRGKQPRAGLPITELAVRGRPQGCGAARAARGSATGRAAARRRKGLWARGKGRFRTRGRYGAGTVRGTRWLTQETCDGTLFSVRSGVVKVSDLSIRRAFSVGRGGSYLAQPPDPRRGTSRG